MALGSVKTKRKTGLRSETDAKAAPVQNRAQRLLNQSSYQEVRRLRCDCAHGVLILRGRVSSYYLKQIAQVAAQKAANGYAIDNAVRVLRRK